MPQNELGESPAGISIHPLRADRAGAECSPVLLSGFCADAAGAGGGAAVGAQGVLAAGGHAQAVCFAGGGLAGAAQAHSDPAAAGVLHQGAGGVSRGGGLSR